MVNNPPYLFNLFILGKHGLPETQTFDFLSVESKCLRILEGVDTAALDEAARELDQRIEADHIRVIALHPGVNRDSWDPYWMGSHQAYIELCLRAGMELPLAPADGGAKALLALSALMAIAVARQEELFMQEHGYTATEARLRMGRYLKIAQDAAAAARAI